MIELITANIFTNIAGYAVGSIVLILLTWALKKIPTEKIRNAIYALFFRIGYSISKFFNGWRYTKKIWENTLEPWLVGFLDMILISMLAGLFDGLASDNDE